jgi:hypothetical protein
MNENKIINFLIGISSRLIRAFSTLHYPLGEFLYFPTTAYLLNDLTEKKHELYTLRNVDAEVKENPNFCKLQVRASLVGQGSNRHARHIIRLGEGKNFVRVRSKRRLPTIMAKEKGNCCSRLTCASNQKVPRSSLANQS